LIRESDALVRVGHMTLQRDTHGKPGLSRAWRSRCERRVGGWVARPTFDVEDVFCVVVEVEFKSEIDLLAPTL
jgi:hypothetical protein